MLCLHSQQISFAGGAGDVTAISAFTQQQSPTSAPGHASPPGSSTSGGTAVGVCATSTGSQCSSPLAASACAADDAPFLAGVTRLHHLQQPQALAGVGTGPSPSSKRFLASRYTQNREWLYRLITFPSYFTPCHSCCGGARTPKREQLLTQFDTEFPYRVYCSHCPECKDRVNSGLLLQVRRSAFKDVVKASDILRFGADVAGVQQYTLNGSKVIYLNREQTPEKKGSNTNAAPAACSVDGRAMMDKSSCYCSLKCKLIAEDAGFTTWLDTQDPSVRILAQAAANAPPRPTAASKRAAQPSSSASSGGSGACSDGSGCGVTSRPPKCARTLSSSLLADTASMRPAGLPLQRAASAAQTGAPAGLKRIRISLPSKRQQSAPSGFMDVALAEEHLLTSSSAQPLHAGVTLPTSNSWLALDKALSCSSAFDGWDLETSIDSPSFVAGPEHKAALEGAPCALAFESDGSMSPALIHAPTAFRSGSGDDWWLCGSPLESAFTCAGMGALLKPSTTAEGSKGLLSLETSPSLSGGDMLASFGPPTSSSISSRADETTTAQACIW